MALISIVVVLEQDALGSRSEICARLSQCGLSVEEEFPELGLIYGRCDGALLPDLARIRGVAEARAEGTIDLPPLRDDTPQ